MAREDHEDLKDLSVAGMQIHHSATAPKKAARKIGLRSGSSDVGVNPKDKIGAAKVDLTLIPAKASAHMAFALMDGATKYGPYNWRVEPVQLRTYISAAKRHLDDFLESEEVAADSLGHHLGHAMACCAIIIDAMF